ncbi:substrate-binding domain-containing protein [Dactylosporangium sp. AC04546]|uniref:substrate-binding domain-containing protein n=1 Tax=Dactylosporangium sp. AC04546 TaxID=2862460 RepID=UPI001EDE0829|nr:substrate-binding domain-containing protein [Dactylosporangium sp. AC04546]WVK83139.1 substrate-binding domain-containing protein [Dactylosporangium sp. AC04546]
MRRSRGLAAAATITTLVVTFFPGQASAAGHARITGTGSSSAANAVAQWVADVQSKGIQTDYTPSGSATGRRDFAALASDFAVSDIVYQGVDPQTGQRDDAQGRPFAYAPVAAGAISFPYQVRVDGTPVTNLRLSGRTLALIFTGAVTNWNDPAITADNGGHELPALDITRVVRSDPSGESWMFSDYLNSRHPDLWQPYTGGSSPTVNFPVAPHTGTPTGHVVAPVGPDGVVNAVGAASVNGTIGYVFHQYARAATLPVARISNAAGYYIAPDPLNVALALTTAAHHPDRAADLGVPADPRAYPLAVYEYAILPTGAQDARMTSAKRQTLVDFLAYAVCGGQAGAAARGTAPLPPNLVRAAFEQLARLGQADPSVDLAALDLAHCANPTIDPADPSRDVLAATVPMPGACDRVGGRLCPAETAGIPAEALNTTLPYTGSLSLQVRLGTRVQLTQVDPSILVGHPVQATDPTGHRRAWVFEGRLDGVAVVDSRPPMPGWSVTGRATDLVSGGTTVAARNVGWFPALVSAGSDAEGAVVAGPLVRPNLEDAASTGLEGAALLASAAQDAGLGTQQLAATMALWMPDTSPKGGYTGTLTLTLISA